MDDLISKSELLDKISRHTVNQSFTVYDFERQFVFEATKGDMFGYVLDSPVVDAEPVRHGRWILNKRYGDYECSECGTGNFTAPDFKRNNMRYCPNCGAKMDAEVKDAE